MKDKLLIVADLGLLKAYRAEMRHAALPRLVLLEEYALTEAHQKLRDKLSDLSGRHRAPNTSASAPMADRHNLELEVRKRLLRKITKKIQALLENREFDGCYLAAGREINHQVLQALTPAARGKIERNVALELTKVEPIKLWEHFETVA